MKINDVPATVLDLLALQEGELDPWPQPEPKRARLRVSDFTVEALGELAAANPRGLFIVRDELVGLFASCDKQGHEGDRTFMLEGWNGRSKYIVDRIGRGHIQVETLCLSMFGGIQPDKLQAFLWQQSQGLNNDGFMQRMQLLVYPDEQAWQHVDESPDMAALEREIRLVQKLNNLDFVSAGAVQVDEKDAPRFMFTAKAQTIFNKWLIASETTIRTIGEPILEEHLSKYRKLIPSLALIFHLVASLDKGDKVGMVGPVPLTLAIRWGEYLLTHAQRIYGFGGDYIHQAVVALAKKLIAAELQDGFTERDVYRREWAHLKDQETVRAACQELCSAGWLRQRKQDRKLGRPNSPAYDINPDAARQAIE
jgi:putative DNA primase/helicase